MSSLGFQLVYSMLNERDDLVCERFFLTDDHQERPLSLESARPLGDFSIIFISVSFEFDYPNIVKILLAGEVEPLAAKRKDNSGNNPLLVCGGVAVFMNPEPIAPLMDFCIIGEAEPLLEDFVTFLLEYHKKLNPEQLYLDGAQQFAGVYAPQLYTPRYDSKGRCSALVPHPGAPERIQRVSLHQCRKAGHSEVLTPLAEFADLYLTELGRGCSRGCRFCAAGFIYRPPRLWDSDAVVEALSRRPQGTKRVGLLGMEMAGSVTLDHIASYIMEGSCALSFSSLRADRINDKLLELLSRSDLKSVAIAPDGASERLRVVINKGLSRSDLMGAAHKLADAGIYKLKLYVMVGLPTETYEDLQEFIDLVAAMKNDIDEVGKKRGRLTEIFVSANCFVPKPWTPFQFHPYGISRRLSADETGSVKEALNTLKEKIAYLKGGLREIANVHFQSDKPDNGLFQALLSRGDRRLAEVFIDMATRQKPWKNSVKRNNIDIEKLIIAGYAGDDFLPWYILDHGINKDYLWHEYEKGFKHALTEPCNTAICRRCGVCGEG